MLTIVAALAYGRPIFMSPLDKRDEANAAKQQLVSTSAAAKSDHLALIAAFNTWDRARLKAGRGEAARVCGLGLVLHVLLCSVMFPGLESRIKKSRTLLSSCALLVHCRSATTCLCLMRAWRAS